MNHGFPREHADADYCYLFTTGRKTGIERETEIWFALHQGTIYVLAGSGERAYWVRNLRALPELDIRLGDRRYPARARDVVDPGEDARARKLLVDKYRPRHSSDLTEWGETALPLAFEPRG